MKAFTPPPNRAGMTWYYEINVEHATREQLVDLMSPFPESKVWAYRISKSYIDPEGQEQKAYTLVARVLTELDHTGFESLMHAFACGLGEDCIAVRQDRAWGKLVGPRADKWGSFKPEFFTDFYEGQRRAA